MLSRLYSFYHFILMLFSLNLTSNIVCLTLELCLRLSNAKQFMASLKLKRQYQLNHRNMFNNGNILIYKSQQVLCGMRKKLPLTFHFSVIIFFWSFGIFDSSTFKCSIEYRSSRGMLQSFMIPHVQTQ
jgi:hypothetical protein